jgi:DNA-binding CsgD family transcriptional regulator
MGLYLDKVTEFISFLEIKNHSIDEILAHLVLRTLRPLEATSIYLFELSHEGTVDSVARYGASELTRNSYPDSYALRDKTPINDCIRSHKSVWITTLPVWPDEYISINSITYTDPEKSFLCFPIEKAGTPVAALGIACMPELSPSNEIDAFLRAIGSVFALHLYYSETSISVKETTKSKRDESADSKQARNLNERQELILKLISEGKTNTGISDLIGYSESTIRQETIKIYSILNCNGREEAARHYREQQEQKSQS